MSTTLNTAVKFHISLNVSNLDRSVNFFRVLFGCEPAKQHKDYAKFEIDEPALVLSLIPGPHRAAGALNHAGLRLADSDALLEVQTRLESAGWQTDRQQDVECCHSRQTKFWVTDPDGTLWELYVLEGEADADDEPHASPAHARGPDHEPVELQQTVFWQHLLVDPLPTTIDREASSVDHVELQGTFNLKLAESRLTHFLAETFRILRPGGRLTVHALAADVHVAGELPPLPGPAVLVQHVPEVSDVLRALETAGYTELELTRLGEKACFIVDAIEMREMRVAATKPASDPAAKGGAVVYRGPLHAVSDDRGNVFRRGERVIVQGSDREALRQSSASEQFAFLTQSNPGCC